MKATYFAITAVEQTSWYDRSGNQRHGMAWYAVSDPCSSREDAEKQAKKNIGPVVNQHGMSDIYAETAHKNMIVVSKSQLKQYRLSPEGL